MEDVVKEKKKIYYGVEQDIPVWNILGVCGELDGLYN